MTTDTNTLAPTDQSRAKFDLWYADHIGDENKPVREAAWEAWQHLYEQAAPAQPVAAVTSKLGDICSFRSAEARKGDAVYLQPPAQTQKDARQPLTEDQIGAAARAAHIAFCLDKFPTFEHALVHFTEQAHAIAAHKRDSA